MRTAVRLTGYAAVLAVAFGAAWGVGSAVGAPAPLVPPPVTAHGQADGGHADDGHTHGSDAAETSDGLAATRSGYTLVPGVSTLQPGRPAEYSFAVTGSDGRPVTAFDVEHDKRMHLIVVRRDVAGFQHLHPEMSADGTWRTVLTLPAGGVYRVFADFLPTGGPELVLGTDLFAPGDFTPIAFAPSRVAQVDGYQVRLDGELVPGGASQVFATVTENGAGVTDLEPYLGAFGHLVALRRSDLAYLHVHPDAPTPAPGDRAGPGIAFNADVPTSGSYRLFLDFRHRGVVHTAEFTVDTTGAAR